MAITIMRLYILDGLSQGGGKDGPACLLEAWMSELPLMNPVLKAVLLLFLTRQLAGLFFCDRHDMGALRADRQVAKSQLFLYKVQPNTPVSKKDSKP
ncbi:MAG: hypothetical protein ACOYLM_05740 [Methylococcaceae bacterium]